MKRNSSFRTGLTTNGRETLWLAISLTDRCPVLFSPVFGALDPRQLAEWVLGGPASDSSSIADPQVYLGARYAGSVKHAHRVDRDEASEENSVHTSDDC